jgi:transposase-like protein
MGKKYSDETKAAVLTALLAGQAVSYVSKEYNVPVGTVKSWKHRNISEDQLQPVATSATQKKADLGQMVLGLLEEELITLQEMTRAVRDPAWIKSQDASEVAVLYGVMQDKAFRKIEAFDKNARTDD